ERRAAIEVLRITAEAASPVSLEAVMERMGAYTPEAESLLMRMHQRELVEVNFGFVNAATDTVLADYVQAKYRDEIAGRQRPVAGEELLGEKLKHSYRLMMTRYNRSVAQQLIDLLARFDFQAVPAILFDSEAYEQQVHGLSRAEVRQSLEEASAHVRLP